MPLEPARHEQAGLKPEIEFRFAAHTNAVPLTDPTVDLDVTFANNGGSDANNRTRADVAAIYMQDQIRLSAQLYNEEADFYALARALRAELG